MFLYILLSVISQNNAIDFVHPVASSKVVLEALGERIGMDLRPSGTVQKDYFLVRSISDSPETIMERIATTLNASWTERNGVRYLGRSIAEDREILGYAKKDLEVAIEQYIEKAPGTRLWTREESKALLRTAILPSGELDRQAIRRRLAKSSPYLELLREFIAATGPVALSALPQDELTYYLWAPSNNERRIPNSMRSKVETTSKSLRGLHAAYLEVGAYPPASIFPEKIAPSSWSFFVLKSAGHLLVSIVGSGRHRTPFAMVTVNARASDDALRSLEEVTLPFTPSPLARELIGRLIATNPEKSDWLRVKSATDPSLIEWYEEGLPIDPLHLIGGEPILAAAAKSDVDVVAVLTDSLVWTSTLRLLADVPLVDVVRLIVRGQKSEYIAQERFLSIGHVQSGQPFARFDRQATATFALTAKRDGWQRIGPLSMLARDTGDSLSFFRALRLSEALQPVFSRGRVIGPPRFHLLKLFGGLSDPIRNEALSRSVKEAYSALPPVVRSQLTLAAQTGAFTAVDQSTDPTVWQWSEQADHLNDGEKVFVLPDDTGVEIRLERSKRFITLDGRGGPGFWPHPLMTPEDAAEKVHASQQPSALQSTREGYQVLALVDAERLTVTIRIPGSEGFSASLIFDSRGPTTQFHHAEKTGGAERDALVTALRRLKGGRGTSSGQGAGVADTTTIKYP